MKLKTYIETLQKKDSFKSFKEKNPDAYLGIVFCLYDLTQNTVRINLDYVTKDKKIDSFETPTMNCTLHEEEIKKDVEKIDVEKITVEIMKVKEIAETVAKEKGITSRITSIIAILRGAEWHITIMDSGLGMTKAVIGAVTGKVTSSEKGSVMGMMGSKPS